MSGLFLLGHWDTFIGIHCIQCLTFSIKKKCIAETVVLWAWPHWHTIWRSVRWTGTVAQTACGVDLLQAKLSWTQWQKRLRENGLPGQAAAEEEPLWAPLQSQGASQPVPQRLPQCPCQPPKQQHSKSRRRIRNPKFSPSFLGAA